MALVCLLRNRPGLRSRIQLLSGFTHAGQALPIPMPIPMPMPVLLLLPVLLLPLLAWALL